MRNRAVSISFQNLFFKCRLCNQNAIVTCAERALRGPVAHGVLHPPHDHDREQQRADGAAGAADAGAPLAARPTRSARRGQVRKNARHIPGRL